MTNQETAGHAIAAMEKLTYDPRSGNNGMRRVTCECGWSRRGSQYTCRRLHGLHAAAEATQTGETA
jgi:hypothetical protein